VTPCAVREQGNTVCLCTKCSCHHPSCSLLLARSPNGTTSLFHSPEAQGLSELPPSCLSLQDLTCTQKARYERDWHRLWRLFLKIVLFFLHLRIFFKTCVKQCVIWPQKLPTIKNWFDGTPSGYLLVRESAREVSRPSLFNPFTL